MFFPLRKVGLKTLKAINANRLAASGGKVRVIVVTFVSGDHCRCGSKDKPCENRIIL